MKPSKLISSTCIAAVMAIAAPAFADQPSLVIKDFIGTITVETSSGADLEVTKKSKSGEVKIRSSRDKVSIDGGIETLDGKGCKGYHGNISWSFSDKKEKTKRFGGFRNLDDYPNITISAPDDLHLVIENAIPFGTAGDIGSADIHLKHCGRMSLGNIDDHADLRITGSGDLETGDIGSVDAKVTGSGDLEFENTGEAVLAATGSGSISFNNAENVSLRASGSSDIEMERISGHLSVQSSGSNDISVDVVGGGIMFRGSGSGDFRAEDIKGDADITVRGSGDVDIEDGEIDNLIVTASGSSDVSFDGTAKDANLSARGSSDIYVKRVTGVSEQKTSGSADIDINN